MVLPLCMESLHSGRSHDGGHEPCSNALKQSRIDCSNLVALIANEADYKSVCWKSHNNQEGDHQAHAVVRKPQPDDGHNNASKRSSERCSDWCGFQLHVALLTHIEGEGLRKV
jgi:hypothetical protein